MSDAKNKFLKDLIYAISHDMSAPARHATSFSSMIMEQAADRLTDKEKQWLQFIHDGGVQAQAQIEALLTLSRLATKASQHQTLTSEELVHSALEHIILNNPTIQFDVHHVGSNDSILLIKSQWHQVIHSFVDNARIFQPTAQEHQKKIHITTSFENNALSVCVEDNGLGVAEKDYEIIKKPFKQLNGEKYPGMGMGLTYVSFIAELHDAELSFAQSTLGGLKVIYTQPV